MIETLFRELAETTRRLSGHEDVTVWYGIRDRYTATIFCKPRNHRMRILRGHGPTIEKALLDLQYQVVLFEKGERSGEQ
jgi:hypothetical protein